jgi:hypothetical protein
MKKIMYILIGSYLSSHIAIAFTGGDIWTIMYTFSPDEIFPSPRGEAEGMNQWVDNIINYLINLIPFLTILISISATIMIILGGFYMVMGWADSSQTEKGKNMIKIALSWVLVGLLAYIIVITLWNIFDV